ncbi:TetR/AcrR family transcriptional regulator [Streptacidiphilus jiangxiensis]|uniref:Regulatory protein, tetR family n=1 Tax=Streptacidiphilus jiangxiensis TaxID=235985 RepID=A0A1H7RHV8_STRJI|nr:TetR/AcrR family transcriptional regulator [Streptacidiphilus jiangxiensis]SEL59900.1 regulatory protein, tetR family [Streptacidiphilus jiangxiensis]
MAEARTPVWARTRSTGRGPQPSLSVESVVGAAIALADAEGLESVSMRRIASELSVGTMSLYRYVETKDDLLDLMIDQVMGEGERPPRDRDWRVELRGIALRYRALVLRHPWVLGVSASRPPLGPNVMDNSERMLAAMDGQGLGIDATAGFGWTVMAYVRGFVMGEIAEAETIRRTGVTEDEYRRTVGPYLMGVLAEGRHPLMARFVHEADDHPDVDQAFTSGLDTVLDGLAVSLERMQAVRAGKPGDRSGVSVAGDSVSTTR